MTPNSLNPIRARAQEVLVREADAVRAIGEQIDPETLAQVIDTLFSCEGHVLVTGAGTSRTVAQRFAHLLSCCGTPALPISAADCLHGGAGAITARDVVFIISKGGRSAEINQLAAIAKGRGALIIAQTEAPDAPLAQICDAIVQVRTPPDTDPYGMIATGTSLVNAAMGDVLCVLLLEKRGYSREAFGETHPGGAVGHQLASQ